MIRVRAIIKESGMKERWWTEAVQHAASLYNYMVTERTETGTSYGTLFPLMWTLNEIEIFVRHIQECSR